MTSLPTTHDAPRSINSAIRTDSKSASFWLHTAMADANLFILIAVCLIGLLVTLNLLLRIPSFGSSVEQIAQILG